MGTMIWWNYTRIAIQWRQVPTSVIYKYKLWQKRWMGKIFSRLARCGFLTIGRMWQPLILPQSAMSFTVQQSNGRGGGEEARDEWRMRRATRYYVAPSKCAYVNVDAYYKCIQTLLLYNIRIYIYIYRCVLRLLAVAPFSNPFILFFTVSSLL